VINVVSSFVTKKSQCDVFASSGFSLGHYRNHTLDISGDTTYRAIPIVHHDLRDFVNRYHSVRTECPSSFRKHAHNAKLDKKGVPGSTTKGKFQIFFVLREAQGYEKMFIAYSLITHILLVYWLYILSSRKLKMQRFFQMLW